MDGCCHNNTARHEHLPKKTKAMQYYVATKGLLKRWNTSFRKVSGQMHSNGFKRRSTFIFLEIISA